MNETWRNAAVAELCFSALAMLAVAADVLLLGRRQKMKIMNAVWPLTALYLGPLGLAAYWWFGRAGTPRAESRRPWQKVFVSASHCGSGCLTGDVVAEWSVFAGALLIAGERLWGSMLVDYFAALLAGFVFQYFVMKPMHPEMSRVEAVRHAVTVDFWSLSAFQLGMYGWMALARFALFKRSVEPTHAVFWLSMQAAMLLGFATTYPVNWYLVRTGLKPAM